MDCDPIEPNQSSNHHATSSFPTREGDEAGYDTDHTSNTSVKSAALSQDQLLEGIREQSARNLSRRWDDDDDEEDEC
jgi:hypothetical protein